MEFINTGLDERILKSLDVEHPSEELVKAMNKQGLVQKEVTVQGKNGTFTRKQWVKASEVKSNTNKQVVMSPEDKDTMSYYGIKGTETLDELNHIRNKASKELKEVFKKYQKADRNGDSSARSLGISAEGKQKYLFKLDKYIDKVKTMQATPVTPDKKNSKPVKSDTSSQKSKDSSKMPKKDTTDKGVLDSKLNPCGYKVGDYLKVKHGRSYTTYQVKSLEKSKGISGKEHVYLNCIEIMKNGQVYDFNHIITADSELISYKIDEPLTLKDPSGKRSKDNFQQTIGGQKLSPADAKKKTQEVTKGVSDKKSFMEKAKAQGITWKENDHEGINWMRCCMAMNKHFENGGSFDNSTTSQTNKATKSNKTKNSVVSTKPISINADSNISKDMVHDGVTFKFSTPDTGGDPFKSNKLSDAVYKISNHLSVGDEMIVSMGDRYKTYFVITAEYQNGNRGYVPVYKGDKERGKKLVKEQASESWRSITDGAAWLTFDGDFEIQVNKEVYK